MIEIKINGDFKLKERFHKALKGSPAYINSEIGICDSKKDNEFYLIVGKDNKDNLRLTMKKENGGKWKDIKSWYKDHEELIIAFGPVILSGIIETAKIMEKRREKKEQKELSQKNQPL